MNDLSIKILSLGIILAAFTVLPVEGLNSGEACEHSGIPLRIDCGKNMIAIKHAAYGVYSNENSCGRSYNGNCISETSIQQMEERCDGRNSCAVGAANRIFGDPCPGVQKYLTSTWDCIKYSPPPPDTLKWKSMPGSRLTVISKGKCGTWGVNKYGHIYKLTKANGGRGLFVRGLQGYRWRRINGNLVDISVGSGVWGLRDRNIYTYEGNQLWKRIPGSLMNVDISDKGHVWGVSPNGRIWRMTAGGTWQDIKGVDYATQVTIENAIQVTVGPSGVWVVNYFVGEVFYRRGTYGDVDSAGTGWTRIPGSMKWISSGRNVVFGVDKVGDTYYRTGMSKDKPTGSHWVKIRNAPGNMRMIEIYGDQVTGTNATDFIFDAKLPPSITN